MNRYPTRPNPTVLQMEVDDWNAKHPVGTAVDVRRDDGSILATTTTSAAWVMGGHSKVVKVGGIAGATRWTV